MFKSVSRSTALLFVLLLAAFVGTILVMVKPELAPSSVIPVALAAVAAVGACSFPDMTFPKVAHITLMTLSAVMFVVVAVTSPDALMLAICLICFLACTFSYGLLAAHDEVTDISLKSMITTRQPR